MQYLPCSLTIPIVSNCAMRRGKGRDLEDVKKSHSSSGLDRGADQRAVMSSGIFKLVIGTQKKRYTQNERTGGE